MPLIYVQLIPVPIEQWAANLTHPPLLDIFGIRMT